MEVSKSLANIALSVAAQDNLYAYCVAMAREFYSPDKPHLRQLCDTIQEFLYDDKELLIVNEPPRHGKSRTLGKSVEWVLGEDVKRGLAARKIITCSYNEMLSATFSTNVRDTIMAVKMDADILVYNDIFPDIKIKSGSSRKDLWSIEGGYNNYLATSPGGTITGFGADLLIIDDIIKNAEEAFNENVKNKHWEWFSNTLIQRLEKGGKICVVMTRWATDDLAGRLLEHYKENDKVNKMTLINMPAIGEDGKMLCPAILDEESAKSKRLILDPVIWEANYQQVPVNIKGQLYKEFKTYDGNIPKFKQIKAYVDTADTGADYFAGFVFGVTFDNEAYILDIIYTKASMEITEPMFAKMLVKNKVDVAVIESNNGGRGYARSIKQILKDKYHTNKPVIETITQKHNKTARILSQAVWVQEHIYFPQGWQNRYADCYQALAKYQKEGKNEHDDAPDALTGVCEVITNVQKPKTLFTDY